MALSSSGLGRGPLTAETRVRFPYALLWKFGWVAETSSLLNCRTGNRSGGSNPPASATRLKEGIQLNLHSRSQSTVYQLITVLFSYIFVSRWRPSSIGWQSYLSQFLLQFLLQKFCCHKNVAENLRWIPSWILCYRKWPRIFGKKM